MLIGITGGMGAGKSTVAKRLGRELDCPVFIADDISRALLRKDESGYREIIRLWGTRFLDPSGDIDRAVLRRDVFADPSIRRKLEAIIHPLVRSALCDVYSKQGQGEFLVAEIPLLFECGWEADFDWVISVYAPLEVSRRRVLSRDGLSREQFQQIMQVQLSPEQKRDRAQSVVDNSGSQQETDMQVKQLAMFLRKKFPDRQNGE